MPQSSSMPGERPVILLYPVAGGDPRLAAPASEAYGCEFTTDVTRLPEADAVLFDVAKAGRVVDAPKYPGQRWIALSMESALHYPWLVEAGFMRHFEITMTQRRDATVWVPYFGPSTIAALLTPPRTKSGAAAAVYLQSSHFDRSGRVEYVRELMKRVTVASFGRVLNNQGGARIGPSVSAKLELIGRYRFTLAFENAREPDYVTEKFYHPLIAGSVPVYLGAPNVDEFAPAPRCFIDAMRFTGPAELAALLNRLLEDEGAYGKYLGWKTTGLDARFLALVARVQRPPLERLCAHLRSTLDPARRPGGRPYYPLRASWYRRLARRLVPAGVRRRRGGSRRSAGPSTDSRDRRP